jgi:hypothetical protein
MIYAYVRRLTYLCSKLFNIYVISRDAMCAYILVFCAHLVSNPSICPLFALRERMRYLISHRI